MCNCFTFIIHLLIWLQHDAHDPAIRLRFYWPLTIGVGRKQFNEYKRINSIHCTLFNGNMLFYKITTPINWSGPGKTCKHHRLDIESEMGPNRGRIPALFNFNYGPMISATTTSLPTQRRIRLGRHVFFKLMAFFAVYCCAPVATVGTGLYECY